MPKKKKEKKKGKYILSSRFSSKERQKALGIITRGVKKDLSTSEIRKQLSDKGLKVRKQNILKDIRRKKATVRAKSPEARKKANRWFDEVFEPFWKQKGMKNSKEGSKAWERAVTQTAETIKEAELNAEFWDFYHEFFPENGKNSDDVLEEAKEEFENS